MRLFVALELEPALRAKVGEIQAVIQEAEADVKLVEPENLHFTLKFLGEVEESLVPEIGARITSCLEGVGQFKISIEGFGYFGSPRYIRALWVDVKEGKEQLLSLAESVSKALDYIRKESHKPSTHLTVGRVKSARNRDKLLEAIDRLKDVKVGEMVVKEIKLKKSELNKTGPVYSDVKVFPLG